MESSQSKFTVIHACSISSYTLFSPSEIWNYSEDDIVINDDRQMSDWLYKVWHSNDARSEQEKSTEKLTQTMEADISWSAGSSYSQINWRFIGREREITKQAFDKKP